MDESFNAYQAVFQFAAWLSARESPLTVGASQDCSVMARLCEEFCEKHGLAEDGYDPAVVPIVRKARDFCREIRNRIREFRKARRQAWLENGFAAEIFEVWVDPAEVESLCSFVEAQANEIERLWRAIALETDAIEQSLGRALGYGCDMRVVGGVEDDVCVGEHVPATLAAEAADKITSLREQLANAMASIEILEAELNGRPKAI